MFYKFYMIALIFVGFQLNTSTQPFTNMAQPKKVYVKNVQEFNAAVKKAVPGDSIVLKNGVWDHADLFVNVKGTKEAPITIKAETNGSVIFTGNSGISLSGSYIIVEGFWFKDGGTDLKSVISFKKNDQEFASNCRVTNCTISYCNPTDLSTTTHWVDLWGKNNRVDHNNFTGKLNHGTTLVVWLKGEEHEENHHQIDHNYFGERPDLGVNGGETIRIGTSTNSMKSSKSLVENNTFEHCNGEIEIISNKSGDNIYRNNLFLESEGTLTLRHGNNALVENNVFLGNNKPKTGGIRVINEGHIIRNNFLVSLAGNGFRGPIVIMNGVPNSPLNRYNQVKNVTIVNNTLINCDAMEFGAGKDEERTLPPMNVLFANNLISNTTGKDILKVADDIKGIRFEGNMVDSEAEVDANYFTKATIDWVLLNVFPMPTASNSILQDVRKIKESPEFDITNAKRNIYVAGAFNLDNKYYPEAMTMITGPSWKPDIKAPKMAVSSAIIDVEPGTNNIGKAIKNAAPESILKLKSGIYYEVKTSKLTKNITIQGSKDGKTIIKSPETMESPLNYFFRINEGVKFTIENVTLDGENSTPVKYAFVSPEEQMGSKYNLFVNHCKIKNFTNKDGGGSVFKAYVGTKADTISIKNTTIENSYRGLNLSYEKTGLGSYNAEVIILYNSVFKNIEEFAVNYVKTIDPLSSNNPEQLLVDHCVFSKVSNYEKGGIIKTKNINTVVITNSVFENSYNLKYPVSLSGFSNVIKNCLIYDSGTLKLSGGAKDLNILYKNPKWEDKDTFTPSEKSDLLKKNNNIERIGLLETR